MYSTRSTDIGIENKSLEKQYTDAKNLLAIQRNKFKPQEWRKLINAISTVDMVVDKYTAIAKLRSAEVNVADVEFLWGLATEGYYQVRSVVVTKYEGMNPSVQIMLQSFDTRVGENDMELSRLLSNPSPDNMSDALILISGTMNYAARAMSTLATSLGEGKYVEVKY